jgi:4-diphosphocytidyl-2-C-methyl-D-erythritol kinase
VNLFLEVLAKRPDGYHDLESIFQAISIYDSIHLRLTDGESIRLTSSVKELETPENLATKAAAAFLRRTGMRRGVEIRLEKGIPMQAGLGGGSSDAAAVLWGLNELTGSGMDVGTLRLVGAEIGSDVPFFIEGGTALVRGRGEVVKPLEVQGTYYFVVLYPGFGISTAAVYRNLRLDLTEKRKSAKLMAAELSRGRLDTAQKRFFNRLEETAFALETRLGEIRDSMRSSLKGAPVMLSGSGASLFSAFVDRDVALEGYRALKGAGRGTVFFAESIRGRLSTAGPKGDSRGYF